MSGSHSAKGFVGDVLLLANLADIAFAEGRHEEAIRLAERAYMIADPEQSPTERPHRCFGSDWPLSLVGVALA